MITLPEAQLLFTVVNAFYLSRFYSLLLTRCFLATFLIFSHFRLYFWIYMHLHANTPPGRPFLFYCELISEPLCASRTGVHALQSIIRSRSINKCISSLSFAHPLSLSLPPFLSLSLSLPLLLSLSLPLPLFISLPFSLPSSRFRSRSLAFSLPPSLVAIHYSSPPPPPSPLASLAPSVPRYACSRAFTRV